MKDLIHNPVFYYLLAVAAVGVWPATLYLKYLPAVDTYLQDQKDMYVKSEELIEAILTLEPERLSQSGAKEGDGIDYASEVYEIGRQFGIVKPPPEVVTTPGTKNEQKARVSLAGVDITQCTNFLSTLQMRWADLKYTTLTLKKDRDAKDKWEVSMNIVNFN